MFQIIIAYIKKVVFINIYKYNFLALSFEP